jgi:chromosomal replication initiator protein
MNEKISFYTFPGIKKELLDKKKYSYLFTSRELKMTRQQILEIIANETEITVEAILSKCRKRTIVDARNRYCKILKESFKMNLVEIGKEMGKDHTTIINSLKRFDERYEYEDDYKELSDRIFNKMGFKLK